MPRFQFALSTSQEVREAGMVQSESFNDALTAISEHVTAKQGDMLVIGVTGFPPARYECVWSVGQGSSMWKPEGRLAA